MAWSLLTEILGPGEEQKTENKERDIIHGKRGKTRVFARRESRRRVN
jgi:hypothetical protein